jgi:hypothetical protein
MAMVYLSIDVLSFWQLQGPSEATVDPVEVLDLVL